MNKIYKQVDILDVTFQVHQLSQCICFDVDGFMCQKWNHSILHSIWLLTLTFYRFVLRKLKLKFNSEILFNAESKGKEP